MTLSIRRTWRAGGVVAGLFLASCMSAIAGDVLFVNNRAGNDAYDGSSATMLGHGIGPVHSVQTALRRAKPGDTIVLMPTGHAYTEPIVVPARSSLGQAKYPITIEGNGVELFGGREIPPEHWQYTSGGVYRLRRPFQPTGVLTSLNGTITRHNCKLWGPAPTLERGEYAFWRGHYYFKPGKPFDLESHQLAESVHNSGIVVDRTSHVVIRNFRIHGFRNDAIQVRGPASSVCIENCLLADNGRAGVFVATNAFAEINGSFIKDNIQAGVIVDNHARLALNAVSIAGDAEPSVVDGTATLDDLGGVPTRLRDGPFLLPPEWPPANALPEELPPEEAEPLDR